MINKSETNLMLWQFRYQKMNKSNKKFVFHRRFSGSNEKLMREHKIEYANVGAVHLVEM